MSPNKPFSKITKHKELKKHTRHIRKCQKMSLLGPKRLFKLSLNLVRSVHNRCRIGNRDWVGYGVNGMANYKDEAQFPFPAVRFKENTKDIWVNINFGIIISIT